MRSTIVLFALVVAACGPIEATPQPPLEGLRLTLIADGLEEPAGLASPPGDDRLFVIERFGRVRVVEDGRLLREPALDLTDEVNSLGEKGLTGLAFHPDFRSNQKVYVLYNDLPGNSRLVEYRVTGADRREFDRSTERLVLELPQDDFFHQGGYVTFGPEGYLWATFGDGGASADPFGRGQDPHSLYATILRIDVNGERPYAIPPDNPFADGVDGAPEVWAYGFRNPWRIAFDAAGEVVIVADVGQWSWEEINIIPIDEPGKNYGWPVLEGESCFASPGCEEEAAADGLVLPSLVYGRDDGCAVIGGPVYRGEAAPELHGHYVYGDHCIGWIRSLELDGGTIVARHDWSEDLGTVPNLMSFGTDDEGEIYVFQRGGRVYRIDASRRT